MKIRLASKITGLVAAFGLVLSGSAYASTLSLFTETSSLSVFSAPSLTQASPAAKCKPKKKCKAPAGFVPGRVVELTYMGPAIGGADTPTINPFGLIAPVNFVPGMGETQALIEIIDDNTATASAGFSWDSNGDGLNDMGIDVCGKTAEPVEMIPGTQYNVFPYLLPSTSCTDGVATSGTIIVTFNKV